MGWPFHYTQPPESSADMIGMPHICLYRELFSFRYTRRQKRRAYTTKRTEGPIARPKLKSSREGPGPSMSIYFPIIQCPQLPSA
uniref:Uncharacterized protein n=1 Tax=Solanum lycopersicum TaxID=4081 RepID=A0A3Q7HVF1_SOLLC